MNYCDFNTLCNSINSRGLGNLRICHHAGGTHIGIHHLDKAFPISINESEFNFMMNIIINFDLKCGFELATGTGISSIGIGRGFKQSGGKLYTMDAYYEELNNRSENIPVGHYTDADRERIKQTSQAYKFVSSVVADENLPVDVVIGWSPHDIAPTLQGKKIDFCFLDSPKSDEEFERDINTIYEFINLDKFFIFVHDTHAYTQKAFDFAKSKLGFPMIQMHTYLKGTSHEKTWRFPLAVITNQKI